MSEFTDYMLYRTSAPTLDGLARELVASVSAATVPLYELGDAAFDEGSARDAAWAALPKPAWVMVGVPGFALSETMQDVWVHLLAEEDFSTWGAAMVLGGKHHVINVVAPGNPYREATLQYGDGTTWPEPAAKALVGPMAVALNVSEAEVSAALVPDGGEAFCTLLGAHYEQMEQLNNPYPDLPNGEVILGA